MSTQYYENFGKQSNTVAQTALGSDMSNVPDYEKNEYKKYYPIPKKNKRYRRNRRNRKFVDDRSQKIKKIEDILKIIIIVACLLEFLMGMIYFYVLSGYYYFNPETKKWFFANPWSSVDKAKMTSAKIDKSQNITYTNLGDEEEEEQKTEVDNPQDD
jgi:hypothetical protein